MYFSRESKKEPFGSFFARIFIEIFTILWYCNISNNVVGYRVKLLKYMIKEVLAEMPGQKIIKPIENAEVNSIKKDEQDSLAEEPYYIEVEENGAREKLFDFLNQEEVLSNKDNALVFDDEKFKSKDFEEKLRRKYFGRKDGKRIFGSKKLIFDSLPDLDLITAKDYQESIEKGDGVKLAKLFNKKDKDSVKEKILDILRENDILQTIDGRNIFDLKKFLYSGFLSDKLVNKNTEKTSGKKYNFSQKLVFEKLSDLSVISKEDYERREDGEPKEVKLFNIPKSIDDAYNTQDYNNKDSDYYLNYWDLRDRAKKGRIQWGYQIELENGEKINARELALAIGVFRDFDGKRDEQGDLLVYDKEKDKHIKINSEWVARNIGGLGSKEEGSSIVYPHKFLLNHCPNLLKKGILTLEDFNIKTSGGQSGELMRKEFTLNKKRSDVAINGVRYYVGRGFFKFEKEKIPTENLKIIVLDEKTAGVVKSFKGKEDLIYTFSLLDEYEKESKREQVELNYDRKLKPKEITARTFVTKEEIDKRISPWRATKDNPQKSNESPEEYAEKIKQISDWGFIKQVSGDFSEECQIGIHNLSWREQQWLASAAYELGNDYPKLLEFGKKYGIDGLKTFLSCEHGIRNAHKILNIGETFAKEAAEKIFKKYAGIQKHAEEMQAEMRKSEFLDKEIMESEVEENIKKNIYDAFMSRATDILSAAHEIAENGGAQAEFYNGQKIEVSNIDEVIKSLEIYEGYLGKIKEFFTESGKHNFNYINSAEQNGLQIYNFTINDSLSGEERYLSLTLRKEGTNEHLENLEYDGEARVNFLFSDEYISPHINDKSRREATTFRLDRECLEFDKTGEKVVGKDNTRKDGRLSLDFGSIYKDSGEENNILGRVISVGNFYTAQEKKKKPEYYHNKESFYYELGQADIFKKIVRAVEKFIKIKYIKNKKSEMKGAA